MNKNTKTVKPNHSSLGPKLKEKAKAVLEKIESMDKNKIYEELMKNNKISTFTPTESRSQPRYHTFIIH